MEINIKHVQMNWPWRDFYTIIQLQEIVGMPETMY